MQDNCGTVLDNCGKSAGRCRKSAGQCGKSAGRCGASAGGVKDECGRAAGRTLDECGRDAGRVPDHYPTSQLLRDRFITIRKAYCQKGANAPIQMCICVGSNHHKYSKIESSDRGELSP